MITDYSQYLKKGKENAIPSAELAGAVGFSDIRMLQMDIAKSRANGQVICSSTAGGYYIPADRAEIEEFIRSMEARAKNTLLAIQSARQAVAHMEGQMNLDDLSEQTDGVNGNARTNTN